MDIVKIVDIAVSRLPEGEYSQGLKAVKRHIASAIRHFEREDGVDSDSFTDAIYRTNQAFEGGLKEAYRVLAGKDPSRKTPYEIENYLEENQVIRPRALKQLTRYREDYRNPSAHDYKLDFDADEALLAIVAVCAFTKLLVNQISGKIAFDSGRSISSEPHKINTKSSREMAIDLAKIISDALSKVDTSTFDYNNLDDFVSGSITSDYYLTKTKDTDEDISDDPETYTWDILVTSGDIAVPIEVRPMESSELLVSIDYLSSGIKAQSKDIGILVICPQKTGQNKYSIYDIKFNDESIIVVTPESGVKSYPERTRVVFSKMKKLS